MSASGGFCPIREGRSCIMANYLYGAVGPIWDTQSAECPCQQARSARYRKTDAPLDATTPATGEEPRG